MLEILSKCKKDYKELLELKKCLIMDKLTNIFAIIKYQKEVLNLWSCF